MFILVQFEVVEYLKFLICLWKKLTLNYTCTCRSKDGWIKLSLSLCLLLTQMDMRWAGKLNYVKKIACRWHAYHAICFVLQWSWQKNRMWRKNQRYFPKDKCYEVDLNRNFPFKWEELPMKKVMMAITQFNAEVEYFKEIIVSIIMDNLEDTLHEMYIRYTYFMWEGRPGEKCSRAVY